MTKLKEITIDEIINQNQTFILMLGYAFACMANYRDALIEYDGNTEKMEKSYQWMDQAITNVIYLKKGSSTMSVELKPCPFCGAENPKISCDDLGWGQFRIRREAWWIQCQGEHCYALQQGSMKEKVINRWNMRDKATPPCP